MTEVMLYVLVTEVTRIYTIHENLYRSRDGSDIISSRDRSNVIYRDTGIIFPPKLQSLVEIPILCLYCPFFFFFFDKIILSIYLKRNVKLYNVIH